MGRSKKNWQNISGRNTDKRTSTYARPMGTDEAFDDSSSQNALRGPNGELISKESFELVSYAPIRDSARISRKASVKTHVEDEIRTPTDVNVKGITNTTSTTVTYQIQQERFA